MNLKTSSVAPLGRLLAVVAGLIFVAGCGGGGTTSTPPPTQAATPSFSIAGGTYTSAQTVTISDATAGATIYYTTNGAAPTTSSTQCTGAITVSSTETIEAIATASGYSASGVASATYTITSTTNNVSSLSVNLGPTGDYVDGLFTSVEVCAPGSTTNCTTVPDVLVDTGSVGLRLLSGSLGGITLPSVTDGSGNDLQECIQFISLAYIWGPVAQADIHLSGETASSASVHIISESPQYSVPTSCLSLGTSGAVDYNSLSALGANGILGVANFPQDCGSGCVSASNGVAQYFVCPSGNCTIASVPTTSQVSNPVALFSQDNNGVLISLPSVPAGGAATASGSLIFGIGTQSNNALGTAQIYATDDQAYFTTTYNGTQYSSFIDSGSNYLSFLDSTTLGGLDCTDNTGWYCPASPLTFTVTNTGTNGTSGSVSFTIENADALFNTGFAAFNDLGGDSGTSPSTDYFDFGVPFFLGRNVFVGIAGTTVPNGSSAPYGYWAY